MLANTYSEIWMNWGLIFFVNCNGIFGQIYSNINSSRDELCNEWIVYKNKLKCLSVSGRTIT